MVCPLDNADGIDLDVADPVDQIRHRLRSASQRAMKAGSR
jgi:hypothetical protein